jgi:type VI secretion system protein ImpG
MSQDRSENQLLRYYEAEMRYLKAASQELAQAQPELAQRLGIGQHWNPDENVERLFQGFSFLMARLRQRLDDGLPEITEPLTDALWPHMVRTIPSLAILELQPRADRAPAGALPAGLTVRSNPLGTAQTVCLYRTTQAVQVLPLKLHDAGARVREDGRSVLRLAFEVLRFDQRTPGDLPCIRLYLHGERRIASALYAAFTRDVQAIDVRMPSLDGGRPLRQSHMKLQACGFGSDTRLWPEDDPKRAAQFDGEQGLLEYFAFAEKFLFVELCGFDAASIPAGENRIEFEFVLKQPRPSDPAGLDRMGLSFDASNVRLNCTPVINLFELDALPIELDAHEREYRVTLPAGAGADIEPYAAVSVVAIDHQTAQRHEYTSIPAFRQSGAIARYEMPERYFHVRNVWGPTGAREMWLSFDGLAWEGEHAIPDHHVALRVCACNGMLPRLALREAVLTEPVSALPAIAAVRNLTQPTMPLYPPQDPYYPWEVMAHCAANRLDMLNGDVLRATLALNDWSGDPRNQRRIDAIGEVARAHVHRIRGGLQRGIEFNLTLDPLGFDGPGDIILFGDVLNRFIARYATYQNYVKLVLKVNGYRIEYPGIACTAAPF